VDADYLAPPAGIPGHEAGAAAQPLGPAPGGGILYGFVPHAPGQVSFVLDHALVKCAGVDGIVGVAAGGSREGTQSFDVDVERLLKADRDSPRTVGAIPAGTDSVDVSLKFDISSYRTERLALAVEGLNGAAPAQPIVELPARDGANRPQPRSGPLP